MKTELRLRQHNVLPGQQVIEIWHDGKFIGQVTGADGPGVRVISKYNMDFVQIDDMMVEVRIEGEL